MAESIETRNLVGSALAVLLLGIAFAAIFRFMGQTQAAAESRAAVNEALQTLDRGVSQLKDAETGQRGFLLTGRTEYLLPYESGREEAVACFHTLTTQTGARQLPPADLADLQSSTQAKLDELAETLRLAKGGRREEALAIVASGRGLQVMDHIRALHDKLASALKARRELEEARAKLSRLRAKRALLVLGGLGLLGLALTTLSLRRDMRLRAASERRFKTLAESAPVGIYEYDFEHGMVYANEAHCRLAGVPREEATRERLRAAVHPEDRPWVIERVEADMRGGLAFDQVYRLLHGDGTTVWVHSRGILVEDPPGHGAGYLIISQDITAMRAAEAEIQAKAAALEAANKELEAFAYSVSHDLRAPLRHIDGFVGLLRRSLGEGVGEQARHQLEVISASARQMGALIDDLLAFCRMGRTEVHETNFDLGALTRQAIQELAPDAAGRDIEWRVEDLPRVHGDPALLRLVLLNLLGNALKFTRGRDPARIRISAEDRDGRVAVTISDNGAGFDMQYADKLFGVFQRLHRQDEFEGTGIGLANVARIVHKHGGTVSAKGALGEGATFSFTLPAPEAP